jgi:DNA sulfur modification protein DndB
MLGELATDQNERSAEYRARKNRYGQKTFRKDEREYAIAEGWEFVRDNKTSLRFQKLKGHDEQLENEFWCLLYNLGYPAMNIGRNFAIQLTSSQDTTVSKQIDVFAYDSESIVIAECKSSEEVASEGPWRICCQPKTHRKYVTQTFWR